MSDTSELRFEFGKNWQSFLALHMDETRLAVSMKHFLDFLGVESLQGLRVLDIGSGSGLHSLAALKAGAKQVVSFDYDQNSVAATQYLWQQIGSPAHWTIHQGSVLDSDFLHQLGQFDLVYCWGVLHHTGQMEQALRLSLQTVAPNGRYYFGLYDSDWSPEPPEFWLKLKQRYVQGNLLTRRLYDAWYIWRFFLRKNPLNIKAFFEKQRDYKKNRGMDIIHDMRDWLGGWPMEYSRFTDVLQLLAEAGFCYKKSKMGEIVTEYLFQKQDGNPSLERIRHLQVKSLRHLNDLQNLPKAAPIYIYGAGTGGQLVFDALVNAGHQVKAFISASPTSMPRPVLKPDALTDLAQSPNTIILASGAFDAMSMTLIDHGITQWCNAYPYILAKLAGYER